MAKRSPKKKPVRRDSSVWVNYWLPFLLAVTAFALYWPSLQAEFVSDARIEILSEGFITSLANLPTVLSLKVLNMHLLLATRPGEMLYLMLNAALWGKEPWGYHLSSNLLHATNVALLFVLLRRLVVATRLTTDRNAPWKIQLGIVAVTLIFAVHPLAVEAVSAINYSSDLLVAFFTFLALLTATSFRADYSRNDLWLGGAGALCAFGSVTCKESGIATVLLLVVYWFLFRREEAKKPWILFLGTAAAMTVAFLAARFLLALPGDLPPQYLGGSFSQVLWTQPRLWVFMLGKLFWPTQLSADYTLEDVDGIPTPMAFVILAVVVLLQIWLTMKSRLGTLGVATYWLGLATVSNFVPLYRILADRFYYLPMAGVAMQLLAVILVLIRSRFGYWAVVGPCLAAVVPMTSMTLSREEVFTRDISLWTDTVQASPSSWMAHYNLGTDFSEMKQSDRAMAEFQKALELKPRSTQALTDMGTLLLQQGKIDEAILRFQQALAINPRLAVTESDLGLALALKGKLDEAIAHYQAALAIQPDFAEVHFNLGNVLSQKGNLDLAITELQKAVEIKPGYVNARTNLGIALARQGKIDESVIQFQEVVHLKPGDSAAQHNLEVEQAAARQAHGLK